MKKADLAVLKVEGRTDVEGRDELKLDKVPNVPKRLVKENDYL